MKTVLLFLGLVSACVGIALPGAAPALSKENTLKPRPLLRVEPVADAPAQKSQRLSSCTHAAEGQFPFAVGLLFTDGWFCSGSLINPCTVLTAAYCVDGSTSVTVYLGSITLLDGTRIVATEIVQHPDYEDNELINDVAIVHLPSSVLLPNIGVVAGLAPSNAGNYAGETEFAIGWGMNGDEEALCWVSVDIITPAQCAAIYGPLGAHDSIICSQGPGNNGVCSISGGPLIQASTGIQIGIISLPTCIPGFPTGYARVSNFRSWIDAQLRACSP